MLDPTHCNYMSQIIFEHISFKESFVCILLHLSDDATSPLIKSMLLHLYMAKIPYNSIKAYLKFVMQNVLVSYPGTISLKIENTV